MSDGDSILVGDAVVEGSLVDGGRGLESVVGMWVGLAAGTGRQDRSWMWVRKIAVLAVAA